MTFKSVTRRCAFLQYLIVTAAVLLVVLVTPRPAAAGAIVADSGFRPEVNGFSFANYANDEGYRNLDAAEVQRIFGRAACLTGRGGPCVLTPSMRAWMQTANQAMTGGHCFGFAVLSQVIFKNDLPRFGYSSMTAFGPAADPFGLDITGSVRLQRSIARAHVFQALDSVTANEIRTTPAKIVDFLIENLKNPSKRSWTMSIFRWGMEAGHTITPYAVEDMGDGKFNIHVYDNNWPGATDRRVHVDTVKNTWNYYATTRPGIPQARYRGNAKSKTLTLQPIREALGTQPCPVCVGRQGSDAKYNQITISGSADQHARLLITDERGRRTGYLNGRLVNRIPGARVLPQASGEIAFSSNDSLERYADSPEPVYLIPKRLKVQIRIDGRRMKIRDRESLGVVGPTFDATIENLKMGPGRVAFATLSPKKQTLSMTGAREESSPRITFGAESDNQAYRIKASAIDAPSRSTFFFAKKPRHGLLRIARKQPGRQDWRVVINQFDVNGVTRFTRRYALKKRQVAFLYYAPLAAGKRAYVVIASADGNKVRLLKLNKLD